MKNEIDIIQLKKSFYDRGVSFKGFDNLTDDDLERIKKQCVNIFNTATNYYKGRTIPVKYYCYYLRYLTNQSSMKALSTFDEKIAFLINAVDPDLQMYKIYLAQDILSNKKLASLPAKEQALCLQKKKESIAKYQSTIRELLGVFDSDLLKYECYYFYKFGKNNELISKVADDASLEALLHNSKVVRSFKIVSDERYNEICNMVEYWKENVDDPNDPKTLAFNILKQSDLLQLKNIYEMIVFFIQAIDSDLLLLRIYDEECLYPKLEERVNNEFGFYNLDLIKLEELFHERFCPDRKIKLFE